MPYYTNPYGNDANKSAIMSVANQYKGIAGVQSPDVFANKVYQTALQQQGSPWTEGSDFGWIRQQIENQYLNQPALSALRGGTQVDIASDPAIAAWLKQTQSQAQTTADAVRAAGGHSGIESLLGPIASIGGMFLGIPPVWAGALGGAISGGQQDGLEGALKGGLIGGGLGYLGGEIASGLDTMAGYQPGVADAIWSEGATGLSSGLAQAGIKAGTNFITGQTKSALGGILGNVMGGSTPTRTTTGGTSSSTTGANTGGGMAGLNLQDLYNMVNPVMGAGASYIQGNQSNAGYDRGINTMLTPSADQQQYRTQLSGLMTDPGSFYQSPVYQAAFDQGTQATERAINAQGLSGSGRELAELQKYGQTFGWDQLMQQVGLLSNLSGITNDSQSRAKAGEAMIGQGKNKAGTTGAISGDLSTGLQQLLGSGQGGSGAGSTSLSSLFNKANEWFNTSGSTQYADLLSQQDGFNWSGIEGVVGGSEQDMMLNDQWDWSW